MRGERKNSGRRRGGLAGRSSNFDTAARAQVAYIDANPEGTFDFAARRIMSSGTSLIDSVLLAVKMNARSE
jgi:hypothetical protein